MRTSCPSLDSPLTPRQQFSPALRHAISRNRVCKSLTQRLLRLSSNRSATANLSEKEPKQNHSRGREPWSSGYGWRLTYKRSWVQILAPVTGWTFFALICCKICIVCLKRSKINDKRGRGLSIKNHSRSHNRLHKIE